jgi:hypothetical protein
MVAARRPYGVVFPILLIVAGGLILLANMGTLPEDTGWRLLQLWPLLLVMLGVQLLVPHLFHGTGVQAVTLLLVVVIALGGFAYAIAGPSFVSASSTRFQSTSPLAGITQGTIKIDDPAEQVNITARDLGSQLYQANIDYSGSAPKFSYAAGDIHVSRDSNLVNLWGRPRDVVTLLVNPSVAWSIAINGAGTTSRIDLSNGNLQSFHLNGAGGNATIIGGPAHGVVRIAIDGAGLALTLQLPQSADYRVTAEGIGTGIDGLAQTSGWSTAADRYEVSITGVGTHASVTQTG